MPTRSDGCVLPSTVPPQEVCTETHQDKGRTSKRATHSGAWRSCRARDAPTLRRRPSTGWRWLSQNAEDRAQALKLCSGRPVNRLCGGAASVGREQFEVWCGVDRNRASGKVGRPTTHPIHIGSTRRDGGMTSRLIGRLPCLLGRHRLAHIITVNGNGVLRWRIRCSDPETAQQVPAVRLRPRSTTGALSAAVCRSPILAETCCARRPGWSRRSRPLTLKRSTSSASMSKIRCCSCSVCASWLGMG
jgi:hypothetical protein